MVSSTVLMVSYTVLTVFPKEMNILHSTDYIPTVVNILYYTDDIPKVLYILYCTEHTVPVIVNCVFLTVIIPSFPLPVNA